MKSYAIAAFTAFCILLLALPVLTTAKYLIPETKIEKDEQSFLTRTSRFVPDPTSAVDSDGDGMPDDWEALYPSMSTQNESYSIPIPAGGSVTETLNVPFAKDVRVVFLICEIYYPERPPLMVRLYHPTAGYYTWTFEGGGEVERMAVYEILHDFDNLSAAGTWRVTVSAQGALTNGILERWEMGVFYNALDPETWDANDDMDGDGLTNIVEYGFLSNPLSNFSDGDSLSDADEVNIFGTNPGQADSDFDGLDDDDEFVYGTLPLDNDTDDDNLLDGIEIHSIGSNATNNDTDGDTLSDGDEYYTYHTSPTRIDTDSDLFSDAEEITAGTNPNNFFDSPIARGLLYAFLFGIIPYLGVTFAVHAYLRKTAPTRRRRKFERFRTQATATLPDSIPKTPTSEWCKETAGSANIFKKRYGSVLPSVVLDHLSTLSRTCEILKETCMERNRLKSEIVGLEIKIKDGAAFRKELDLARKEAAVVRPRFLEGVLDAYRTDLNLRKRCDDPNTVNRLISVLDAFTKSQTDFFRRDDAVPELRNLLEDMLHRADHGVQNHPLVIDLGDRERIYRTLDALPEAKERIETLTRVEEKARNRIDRSARDLRNECNQKRHAMKRAEAMTTKTVEEIHMLLEKVRTLGISDVNDR